jgi:enediyne biosynthesis protein E4
VGRTSRSFAITVVAVLLVPVMPAAGASSKPEVVVPRFSEEAVAAGVKHAYAGAWEFSVGGGVATFDCNDDGLPEVYLAGGTEPAVLYRNHSPVRGKLRFERLESEATDLPDVVGAYPLDIDSDGYEDLVVLRRGEDLLLRGTGDCAFERANERWGFDGGDAWTTAFSATWEAGQTWPTLAFGTYVDHFDENYVAHCGIGSLFRPASGMNAFAEPIPLEPGDCALSMLFSDWDRTGQRDLRVSNDRHYYYTEGEEQLWRLPSDSPPELYTDDEGWKTVQIWGMGIASADVTGDGLPEYYLTSIGENRLETLEEGDGEPTFGDVAYEHGISSATPWIGRPINPSTSWHPEFDDVNNDGRVDLFITKGNVDEVPDNAMIDPNELYLGLPDGSFLRAAKSAGIKNTARTRGAAVVDLNGDGLLDLIEVNRNKNVTIRRNLGRGTAGKPKALGHWLEVKPEQQGPNRDAVGAWIEVEAGPQRTEREVTVGGGHASGSMGPIHIGLGKQDQARVRVTWPDGTPGEWRDVAVDGLVTIDRAADDAPAAAAGG